tara:strand:+ start:234 stop:419 length:186 start_codon:yes stop_codon:yes gene_type:complete
MRYLLIILVLSILTACNTHVSNNDDLGLQIDIYKKDMTYEKFKQKVIEYADEASFPTISNK